MICVLHKVLMICTQCKNAIKPELTKTLILYARSIFARAKVRAYIYIYIVEGGGIVAGKDFSPLKLPKMFQEFLFYF